MFFVTVTPGIIRKRNRSVAVEYVAMLAHFSLPCRPSRYALTVAITISSSDLKPSSSVLIFFSTIVIFVFIFPKLISHLPVPVEPQEKIYRVPYLLHRIHVIRKEAARGTVTALIKMTGEHDDRLLGRGRHGVFSVMPLFYMLIAFGIGYSGGDVPLDKTVILVMLQNKVCFYFFKQCTHTAAPFIIRLPS